MGFKRTGGLRHFGGVWGVPEGQIIRSLSLNKVHDEFGDFGSAEDSAGGEGFTLLNKEKIFCFRKFGLSTFNEFKKTNLTGQVRFDRNLSFLVPRTAGFDGDILITDVKIDERDGAHLSGIFVVVEFIVLGIGQIDFCIGLMHREPFFDGDKMVAFLGVSSDGEASYGEFEA